MSDILQYILDNPNNDEARLVYADWLEDHGYSDHGQLIRLQIEQNIVRKCSSHPTGVAFCVFCGRDCILQMQILDHLDKVKEKEPIWQASEQFWVDFKRGFVDTIHCNMLMWTGLGPKLLKMQPITTVDIIDKDPYRYALPITAINPPSSIESGHIACYRFFEGATDSTDVNTIPHDIFNLCEFTIVQNGFPCYSNPDLVDVKRRFSNGCLKWAHARKNKK